MRGRHAWRRFRRSSTSQDDVASRDVVAHVVVAGDGDLVTDVFDDTAGAGRAVLLPTIEKGDRIAGVEVVCGALKAHVIDVLFHCWLGYLR